MTARELIKFLEGCNLDKDVTILISILDESETGYGVMMREVVNVLEKEDFVIIQ